MRLKVSEKARGEAVPKWKVNLNHSARTLENSCTPWISMATAWRHAVDAIQELSQRIIDQ